MGRTLEPLQIKGVKNGTSSLNVKYHYRGGDKGKTDFEVSDENGNTYSFNLNTPEEALKLAKYLEEQVNYIPDYKSSAPTYETTGYALKIYCAGTLIRTISEFKDHKSGLDSFSYESLRRSFPQYSSDDYFFAVYSRKANMSPDRIGNIVEACIQHQSAVLTSGDLRTCKPMKLEDIVLITGYDISQVSRALKENRIFTCHRTYSLDNHKGTSTISLFHGELTNRNGDPISTVKIRQKISDLIEKEDKSRPLTDEQIAKKLSLYGVDISRRTVAKYRDEKGIPISRNRKNK